MKIEAVTICVDYGDFLAHTLPRNKPLFDRLLVVTSSPDQRTHDICEYNHVECITTDVFFAGEKAFSKSAGINIGLQALKKDGWVAHFDADIVLPPRGREMIERAAQEPKAIYGCDRICCDTFDDWCRYVSWPQVMHAGGLIHADEFRIGARLLKEEGWAPIGFFQLWNPGVSGNSVYPGNGSVDHSDMAFSRLWPRSLRQMIPELIAVHLASSDEGDMMGINWRGRRSPHFGPEPCPRPHKPGVYDR